MFDFGISKLMIIGVVALLVVGPEKLPRLARTVGTLLGRAQRYTAELKAEVRRSVELDELRKIKDEAMQAAQNMHDEVSSSVNEVREDLSSTWNITVAENTDFVEESEYFTSRPLEYRPIKKNWRSKQAAIPRWYKVRGKLRTNTQSGAARVARFRPK